jgi:hypothetical protein
LISIGYSIGMNRCQSRYLCTTTKSTKRGTKWKCGRIFTFDIRVDGRDERKIVRDIRVAEIEEAITGRSEVIEDYPEDKYGSSCLIVGFTKAGRPLHMQCSYPSRPLIRIVTVYEPDPNLWIDLRMRIKR